MSTDAEKTKKMLEDAQRAKEQTDKNQQDKEQVARDKKAEKDKADALLNAENNAIKPITPLEPLDKKKDIETSFSIAKGGDWDEVIKAYKEKYPDSSVNKDGALQFKTRGDAINFFKEQAEKNPPLKFFATEMDNATGKAKDFHVFSCGDGKLYQGSLEQIKKDLEANPNEHTKEGLKTITAAINTEYKKAVQDTKTDAKAKEGTKNELDVPPSSPPRPKGP